MSLQGWNVVSLGVSTLAGLAVLAVMRPMAVFNSPVGYYLYRLFALGVPPHSSVEVTRFADHGVRIIPIPFASDNLAYAVFDESNDSFVLVDPGDAAAVRCALRLVSRTATVAAVLATHHHWDHSAGNASFRALLNLGAFSAPRVDVFGSRVDFPVNGFVNAGWHRVNRHLEDRETFQIGRLLFRALLAPCHTRGHLIYILEGVAPSDSPVKSFKPSVFTGDAFFVGGCGRFFEGSGNDMHTVVQKCIDAIPEEALMWPGHEYSFSNLKFAVTIEPGNSKLQIKMKEAEGKKKFKQANIPSGWSDELAFNPFLRAKRASDELWTNVIHHAMKDARLASKIAYANNTSDSLSWTSEKEKLAEVEVLTALRLLKDSFK